MSEEAIWPEPPFGRAWHEQQALEHCGITGHQTGRTNPSQPWHCQDCPWNSTDGYKL